MMQITFFDALKDGFSEKTTFRVGVNFLFLTSHFLFFFKARYPFFQLSFCKFYITFFATSQHHQIEFEKSQIMTFSKHFMLLALSPETLCPPICVKLMRH